MTFCYVMQLKCSCFYVMFVDGLLFVAAIYDLLVTMLDCLLKMLAFDLEQNKKTFSRIRFYVYVDPLCCLT